MKKKRARTIAIAIAALAAISCMLSACSRDRETGSHDQTGTAHIKHVTYRLKWLFNASSAGDIWAQKGGFFTKADIEVNIKEGGAEQDAITDIEMGRAQFGTASADQVIRAVSKGADIVVLAQIFQKNPLQWIYFADMTPEIKSPQDLKGLTIGITYGGNDQSIFMALMQKYHLTTDDVNLYAVHYDYNPFWRHKVTLWPVYRNTEGVTMERKMASNNHHAAFFEPDRHGINFVANSVVTSGRLYRHRPELAKAFTTALMAAWRAALAKENRMAVATAIHALDCDTPLEIIMKQLECTGTFVLTPDRKTGEIDHEAWKQTEKIMSEQGLIKQKIEISKILVCN